LVTLAGGVFADALPPAKGTLPFYWITGTLSGTTEVGSRAVIFYKDNIERRAQVTTESSGKYRLNAYELQYYFDVPVTLEAGTNYNLAVVRRIPDDFGTLESVSLTTEAGYLVKDLTCVLGGGPILETWGTGPLVNVSVYLEGFYERGNSAVTTLEVREAADRDMAANSADPGTTIIGACEINVTAAGTGHNYRNWTTAPVRTTPGVGKHFYAVLKHMNHLSIMLTAGFDAIGDTSSFDFTNNANIYRSTGAVAEPMIEKEKDGRKWMMRGGDANMNKKVEINDYNYLMRDWELSARPTTDFNGDNVSELNDYNVIMNNWEIESFVK
jgi:hypothetical protein